MRCDLQGTEYGKREEAWDKVVKENPNSLKIRLFGKVCNLIPDRSISGKTVKYIGNIDLSPDETAEITGMKAPKSSKAPRVIIDGDSDSYITNGGKGQKALCPSLIEIL